MKASTTTGVLRHSKTHRTARQRALGLTITRIERQMAEEWRRDTREMLEQRLLVSPSLHIQQFGRIVRTRAAPPRTGWARFMALFTALR